MNTTEVVNKLLALETHVNEHVLDRREQIRMALLCMITGQHMFVLGEPGTSKSRMFRMLAAGVSGKYFETTFSKFTQPEDVFGQYDMAALNDNRLRRVTKNRFPEAEIFFGDEIFRAGQNVLNTFLLGFNERKFENEGEVAKIPLHAGFAAANSVPEDAFGEGELAALWDRLIVRMTVNALSSMDDKMRMLDLADDISDPNKVFLTMEELRFLQAEARKIAVPEIVNRTIIDLVDKIRMTGVRVSDRRMGLVRQFAKASAMLFGSAEVALEDLAVCSHILWQKPSEASSVAKVVYEASQPVAFKADELMRCAEDMVSEANKKESEAASKEDKGAAITQGAMQVKGVKSELEKLIATSSSRAKPALQSRFAKLDAQHKELVRKAMNLL